MNPSALRRLPLSAFALFAISVPHLVFAQAQASTESSGWGLGLGVASIDRPYIGAGAKTVGFPVLSYEGEYLRVAGTTADLRLAGAGSWTLSLRGRYAIGGGYKAGDAPILLGMEDRKDGFWLGAAATWNAGFARISLEALSDASGYSKGFQGKVGIERDFLAGSFIFTPHAAIQYLDKKYVNYYYGVASSEATSFRSGYDAAAAVNVQAGLRTTYRFDPRNSVFLDVSVTALGKEIKNSPLVDKKTVPSVVMGYLYRF